LLGRPDARDASGDGCGLAAAARGQFELLAAAEALGLDAFDVAVAG
jgi:hypothetical protein